MKPKKILLVDDDHDVLEACQLMLMDERHTVVTASNGREAVTKHKEFSPDIVLMDVRMPGISGYEAFLDMYKQNKHTPVVLTSCYALDEEQYKNAKKHSLVGLITKPIQWEDLERVIKKCST